MAMGKRRRRARQASMWIPTSDLPRSAAHPFYRRLNRILDEAGFDAFVEAQCEAPPVFLDTDERRIRCPRRLGAWFGQGA